MHSGPMVGYVSLGKGPVSVRVVGAQIATCPTDVQGVLAKIENIATHERWINSKRPDVVFLPEHTFTRYDADAAVRIASLSRKGKMSIGYGVKENTKNPDKGDFYCVVQPNGDINVAYKKALSRKTLRTGQDGFIRLSLSTFSFLIAIGVDILGEEARKEMDAHGRPDIFIVPIDTRMADWAQKYPETASKVIGNGNILIVNSEGYSNRFAGKEVYYGGFSSFLGRSETSDRVQTTLRHDEGYLIVDLLKEDPLT